MEKKMKPLTITSKLSISPKSPTYYRRSLQPFVPVSHFKFVIYFKYFSFFSTYLHVRYKLLMFSLINASQTKTIVRMI